MIFCCRLDNALIYKYAFMLLFTNAYVDMVDDTTVYLDVFVTTFAYLSVVGCQRWSLLDLVGGTKAYLNMVGIDKAYLKLGGCESKLIYVWLDIILMLLCCYSPTPM